jgi:DNA topoisomerase I
MQNLVIVESPAKGRSIERYLGSGYQVVASMGHVRDLPKSELGVDTDNFEPKYIIPRDKKKRVNELKKLAKGADAIWLASDPDREGESIAWHLKEVISDQKTEKREIKRVVFHEITEEAIKEAFKHPRELDLKLVDAQQARRVLDRLVGYKLSPLLWKKVKAGLSAGRVQSVALRLIVEREREIGAFKAIEYWSIEAELGSKSQSKESKFVAALIEKDGKKLEIKDEKEAKDHLASLEKADYSINKITKKEVKRNPYPPFTTSTLQQAASNKLGMSAKKTMMIAQNLYEQGFITYMRTDSVNLSATATTAVRLYIGKEIGAKYLPSSVRVFKSKSKNAQEAHEAIRPTNVEMNSDKLGDKNGMTRDHTRLYDLVWKRFLACQMSEAVMDQTTVDVRAGSYGLRATGSIVKFDGWLKLYGKDTEQEEPKNPEETESQRLPQLSEGEILTLLKLIPQQHFTEPPPRFTEASLIKKLEELGIGRPSTYAPILSTITDRFYVEKVERKFTPTSLGITVMDFLIKYFPDVFEYQFTAQMEDELDSVSRGEAKWQPVIKEFYVPFEKKIASVEESAEHVKLELEISDKLCPECGKNLVVRTGKFGKFLACSGFPECKHTEVLEQLANVKCPLDNGEVVVRRTKKGKTFFGCQNWPNCKFASWTKPKPAVETVTPPAIEVQP